MLVGVTWYRAVFGRAWRTLASDPQPKPSMAYPAAFVANPATAFVLAYVTSATSIALGNGQLAPALFSAPPGLPRPEGVRMASTMTAVVMLRG